MLPTRVGEMGWVGEGNTGVVWTYTYQQVNHDLVYIDIESCDECLCLD